jgi:hypothetical protein
MRPGYESTRPQQNVAVRTARRGWALARAVALVIASGLLVALVLATLFAGLVIAIDGKLP